MIVNKWTKMNQDLFQTKKITILNSKNNLNEILHPNKFFHKTFYRKQNYKDIFLIIFATGEFNINSRVKKQTLKCFF